MSPLKSHSSYRLPSLRYTSNTRTVALSNLVLDLRPQEHSRNDEVESRGITYHRSGRPLQETILFIPSALNLQRTPRHILTSFNGCLQQRQTTTTGPSDDSVIFDNILYEARGGTPPSPLCRQEMLQIIESALDIIESNTFEEMRDWLSPTWQTEERGSLDPRWVVCDIIHIPTCILLLKILWLHVAWCEQKLLTKYCSLRRW